MLTIFETILDMSLTASVVILVVLLARVLLSKAPKKYAYLLWLVVAFRLCVPFSFESSISIFNTSAIPSFDIEESMQENVSETVSETISETETVTGSVSTPEVSDEISVPSVPVVPNQGTVSTPVTPPVSTPVTPPVSDRTPEVSAPTTEVPNETPVETPAETPVVSTQKTNLRETIGVVLASVWALGIICMLGCGIISYIKLKKRLQNAVLLYDNVYGSDRIGSPFALGIFRPRIYIPFGMNEEATSYILAHERYHLKRLDHLVKPLSFLVLSVHWFNPFCWLAFSRMSLDMELSCDERVLKQFGDENMKKKYSKTLLDFATDNRYPTPTPISFSEGAGAKTRIKHALYWKKPRFWVSAIAILLCAVVLVACAANAVSKDPSDARPDRLIDFDDTPYQLVFTSNGDGTCVITDIKTDYEHTEPYDLVIPEKSPDGDKVVEVDMSVLSVLKEPNVPTYLTAEQYDAIANTIQANTAENSRELKTFAAFYSARSAQDSEYGFAYYQLETRISEEECVRVSRLLSADGEYSAEDCYRDAVTFLERLPETERAALQPELFRYLYRSAFDIQKVVLPSKDINVHQGFLDLPYELTDGTEITPAYEIPISVSATDEQGEVFDQTHNCNLRFDFARPVKEFAVIRITNTVFNELEEANSAFNAQAGDCKIYAMSVWSSSATRAITFVGEDNKKHFCKIVQSYPNGEYTLEDITYTQRALSVSVVSSEQKEETDRYAEYRDEHAQSDDLELMLSTSRPIKDVTIFAYTSTPSSGVWWDQIEITKELYTAERLTRSLPLYFVTDKSIALGARGIRFVDEDGEMKYYAICYDGKDDGLYLKDITEQLDKNPSSTENNDPDANTETIEFKVNNDLPFYEAILTLSDEGTESIATSLAIRDTETGDYLQTIEIEDDEYCQGKKPIAADVNFDHNLDILVLYQTPARADYYHAFVYDEASGEFVHAPSFAHIPNYKLDTENNRILGYSQGDMRVNYEVAEYDENAKDFVFTNSLYYEYIIDDADGDTIHFVEYENSKIVAEYTMQGNGNYYLVDENDDRMKPYLAEGSFWDLNSNKWHTPVQSNDEDIVASYDYNGGTLYHADLINSYNERLYLIKDDGTRVDICEQRLFSYLAFSDDQSKLIWNDYEWEWNATVCVYDIASQTLTTQPMDDLGTSYTPSYMAWLDNRYFLFVSQYDMGTITRGGDIFVYDTETHEYRILIDAYKEGSRELMIESFAVSEQSVSFRVYDYDYDIDMYENWTYTLSTDEIYDLIGRQTFTIFLPKDESGFVCPVRVEVAIEGAQVDFYDEEEIDYYGMGEIVHTFTLIFDRPVTEFSFIKLDDADVLDFCGIVEDQYNLTFGAGDTYTVATYIKDIHVNRGIAFRGDDGKMRYYAIYYSMNTGTFGLGEITDYLWM